MTTPRRIPLIIVLLSTVVAGWAQVARPLITLHEQALTVDTPEVRLDQVAVIQAPAELAPRLGTVTLGSRPVPGTARRISGDYIRLRLRRFGIDPAQVNLQGEGVTVRAERPSISSTGELLAEATIQPEFAVRRGQVVEVQVRCGGVLVRTTGIASRDGRVGELLPLRLERTGLNATGRALESGRVTLLIPESHP